MTRTNSGDGSSNIGGSMSRDNDKIGPQVKEWSTKQQNTLITTAKDNVGINIDNGDDDGHNSPIILYNPVMCSNCMVHGS
jgi:hypothetical protein